MKHSLYTYHFSFKFRVLLMLQKMSYEILWHFVWMLTPARNVEKNNAKCKKSDVKYRVVHFSFFAFCAYFVLFCTSYVKISYTCYTLIMKHYETIEKLKKKWTCVEYVWCIPQSIFFAIHISHRCTQSGGFWWNVRDFLQRIKIS